MKKLILIFSVLLLLISCNNKKEKEPIEVIRSVEFKTGFIDVFFRFMGYFYDKEHAQEYVYLSNPQDCIKIFNINGKPANTISLQYMNWKFKGSVEGIAPYSNDTILLFSEHGNNIAFVNSSGKIIKSFNINNILPDSAKYMFEYHRFLPYQPDNNKIFFLSYLDFAGMMNKFKEKKLDVIEWYIFYYSYFLEQPYLLEIYNIFHDSIRINFHLHDYYKKYHTTDDIGMSYNSYFKEINNFFFIISGTENKIHKINNKTYEYLQDLEINSNFTNIGFTSIAPENFPVSYKIQDERNCCKGGIQNIFYNSKNKQYYIIVAHELKNIEEWKKLHNGDYRQFSVIIYDENFENYKEYAFEAHSYICRNSFMSEEGLWMQRKPEKLTKENYGTQTFDLLEFN